MAAVMILVLLTISFIVANSQIANIHSVEKPGSCSPPIPYNHCQRYCENDAKCPGIRKCCPTQCGGTVCTNPVTVHRPSVNPGSCPDSSTGKWVCSSTCRSDGDCRGRTKCCKNRCGASVCRIPRNQPAEVANNSTAELTTTERDVTESAEIPTNSSVELTTTERDVTESAEIPNNSSVELTTTEWEVTESAEVANDSRAELTTTERDVTESAEIPNNSSVELTTTEWEVTESTEEPNNSIAELSTTESSVTESAEIPENSATVLTTTESEVNVYIEIPKNSRLTVLKPEGAFNEEHSGSCPVRPKGNKRCISTCATDGDCPKIRKCCKNRCGAFVCQRPAKVIEPDVLLNNFDNYFTMIGDSLNDWLNWYDLAK